MKKWGLWALTLVVTVSQSQQALAWGGRGHDSICESATYLVENKNLKAFLQSRPHVMGHLCNVPDIYWKGLGSDERKHGDPTHYIDPEILGIPFEKLPTDFKTLMVRFTGAENMEKRNTRIVSVPFEMGSNWWRAEQFFNQAVGNLKIAAQATTPSNSKEEQDDNNAYNKAIFQMMVHMGLLGHFVGDNAQPYHNTSDYDGYGANHGGIHSYYEEQTVAYWGSDLQDRIVKNAQTHKKDAFMKKDLPVVERMKILSLISYDEIKLVNKADPVITPSTFKKEKGMSLKSPAKRKSAEEGFKKFEKLHVNHMGRAAALLASLWDKAYEDAGSPDLKSYKSYRYPFTPDFIFPDYYDIKKEDAKKD